MQLSEKKFFKQVEKMSKMHGFTLESSSVHCGDERIKSIFDRTREINKQDPNFIYTCQRINICTYIWYFAYSNEDVYKAAYKIAMEYGEEDKNWDDSRYTENCSCPYE